MRYIMKKIITLSILTTILCGCASSNPPQSTVTEADIYHQAMQQSNAKSLEAARTLLPQIPLSQTNADVYADTAHNAKIRLDKDFPMLPNPQTLVYVYPHLGPNGVPIPGYYTKFYLYAENHYALPGEVEKDYVEKKQ